MVNPGDEVILIFDPYFVMYNNLVALAKGTFGAGRIRTPDFHIDAAAVDALITPRTKCILVNSPKPTRRGPSPGPRR